MRRHDFPPTTKCIAFMRPFDDKYAIGTRRTAGIGATGSNG
jgi:hypothetical protein